MSARKAKAKPRTWWDVGPLVRASVAGEIASSALAYERWTEGNAFALLAVLVPLLARKGVREAIEKEIARDKARERADLARMKAKGAT